MRLVSIGLFVLALMGACTRRASVTPSRAEQLTCGDSMMPLAVYARAPARTEPDSFAGIAVTVTDSARHHVQVEDVQVWGPRGAVGEPGSPTGRIPCRSAIPG
jgi:hypothetical protein